MVVTSARLRYQWYPTRMSVYIGKIGLSELYDRYLNWRSPREVCSELRVRKVLSALGEDKPAGKRRRPCLSLQKILWRDTDLCIGNVPQLSMRRQDLPLAVER